MNSEPTGLVRYRLDPDNPPTLTPEERQAWEELKNMRDEDIDLSDIPEQTGGGWRRVSDLVPEANKQQITLRLDADVIQFFRSTGRRYQSRINAALRDYVKAHKKSA
ncbi:MAG: BrnA antitoxin family protein [Terracidiphilus sp.]